MKSLHIGIVLLLIAASIIADNSVIDQNEQHIRTRRDTTSFNETEMANITATADSDDNDDDDVGVIYVCGDNTTDDVIQDRF
uniref:Uncharacterized protein n=1 Tax=Panagrolaimus davidi TaxID=227884 RepID=A0A914Q9D0_9BILA